MKSFFSSFAGLTTTLSLLLSTDAIPLKDGPSCGVSKTDENSFFSVVGVQGTGVHPRQELRELEKDSELWNIFLQAFARFQAMDQNDKVSYFKVAGIHGAPFGEWDGATGEGMTGYCPHVSNMFGPWHRPYLALFEQILHDRAVEVAKEYPVGQARNKALEIANRVRLPYWDWATDPPDSDEGCMPSNLRRPTATITFPNGTTGQIANPLYRYDFHPLKYEDFSALSEFQFKNWSHTIRFPLDGHSPNATSRNDEANARVGKQQPNNRDMLYKLLTIYQPFNQWSNKANGGTIGNIETLHDGLHNAFGLGNMGIVEVSAFDPVFWFHHCNMDRIIALYQYRYPDTWVEDSVQNKPTYTMPKGSTQGAQSPLAPFHMNAKGDMWTSDTSRNWTSFGYTYPELQDNPSNETLTKSINTLYKPQTQGLNKNDTLTVVPVPQNTTNATADAIDWLAEVHMPTDILISYSVRAFLGEPNKDPKKWATDPNYVGQIASMSSPRMNSDVIVSGSIVLTDKLAEKYKAGDLKSLRKDDVTSWLKDNFHWRIQALDFSEIPRNNPPPGLNVTVFNVPIHLPESDTEVPTWTGTPEYDPEIKGNPPVYNGAGPGGVNTTVPEDQTAGSWNSTSGEWVWKNATDSSAGAGAGAGEEEGSIGGGVGGTATLTQLVTQFVTVEPGVEATPSPLPSSSSSEKVETLISSSSPPSSSSTPRVGTRVIEITSIVTQFATVAPQ